MLTFRSRSSRREAFTLLELLLTLLVMAVILLIGLGVTRQGRREAVGVQCVSRLRQIGVALFAYANDHHHRIPPRVQHDPKGVGYYPGAPIWFEALRAGGYTPSGPFTMQSLHFCPEFLPPTGGMEAYGLRRWRSPGGAPDISQSLLSIENRADFFLMAESYNHSTGRQGYCIDGYSQWRVNAADGRRVKALFADGHVAIKEPSYFGDLHLRQAPYHVGSLPYQVHPAQ